MNPNFTSVMEGAAESTATARAVGFRFHPRDDELVNYYLRYKLLGENTGSISIPEIKVYSFDPWELLGWMDNKLDEWIFYCYCPRHYKYVNSKRSNRTTKNGHWKPTGKVREVKMKRTKKKIGTKKTLVFYKKEEGSSKGIITQYVMHEYEYIADPNSPSKVNCLFIGTSTYHNLVSMVDAEFSTFLLTYMHEILDGVVLAFLLRCSIVVNFTYIMVHVSTALCPLFVIKT
ncbi:unnamed protein product [Linum tenue]|uniref:NAC domain-containing protein n=1 Tax=Linum tenue TaxID=586396 RepID=A0AAV0LHB8_9ROSI|nr:unnamed protein product [Linum tenue]